ncbi:protein PAXX isoform X2 [Natator depressus]|uniref:protein PAXX isoform X2 n=1 Tax=Natator depressus TaxID=27790 RepID=UPI003EBECFD8
MAEPAGPFYALGLGDRQYLCYCGAQESGGFNIYVTNASEVWSTDFTLEKLEGHKAQSGMCPSEDYSTKFREAFEHRAAALTVHDSKATLQLKEGTWSLTFDLFKLPCSEARNQLQALMFGLVGCVSSLEKRLEAAEDAAASCSPEKNLLQSQRLLIPGFTLARPQQHFDQRLSSFLSRPESQEEQGRRLSHDSQETSPRRVSH